MQSKIKLRIIVDSAMSALMVLMMVYQFIGNVWHEYLGIALFCLAIIHNILNRKFYASILKGRYNTARVAISITDILLLEMMCINAVSAVAISRYAFSFLNISASYQTRSVHVFSGWWTLVLMSVHIGLHCRTIAGYIKKSTGNRNIYPAVKWTAKIILIITDIIGVIAFSQNGVLSKLTMHSVYSFYEDSNAPWEIYKIIAIMCLVATVTYGITKIITSRKVKK